jgi:hypothetical protein
MKLEPGQRPFDWNCIHFFGPKIAVNARGRNAAALIIFVIK